MASLFFQFNILLITLMFNHTIVIFLPPIFELLLNDRNKNVKKHFVKMLLKLSLINRSPLDLLHNSTHQFLL